MGRRPPPRRPTPDERVERQLPRPQHPRGRLPRHLPRGRLPPNGYGLHNMTGNVWEWTAPAFGARGLAAGRPGRRGHRGPAAADRRRGLAGGLLQGRGRPRGRAAGGVHRHRREPPTPHRTPAHRAVGGLPAPPMPRQRAGGDLGVTPLDILGEPGEALVEGGYGLLPAAADAPPWDGRAAAPGVPYEARGPCQGAGSRCLGPAPESSATRPRPTVRPLRSGAGRHRRRVAAARPGSLLVGVRTPGRGSVAAPLSASRRPPAHPAHPARRGASGGSRAPVRSGNLPGPPYGGGHAAAQCCCLRE
ncbi:SUMF1/EgtB/PvdO family nonheme iron enzyme [Streptomyces sp. NPDC057686]|uniref:SUMF1/EgtB/PvdO family nonheme iron enzyme n=1 Tax=Streptomyces sp. NPDC057686 TaxID=3346212 RepID=UPI0036CA4241